MAENMYEKMTVAQLNEVLEDLTRQRIAIREKALAVVKIRNAKLQEESLLAKLGGLKERDVQGLEKLLEKRAVLRAQANVAEVGVQAQS